MEGTTTGTGHRLLCHQVYQSAHQSFEYFSVELHKGVRLYQGAVELDRWIEWQTTPGERMQPSETEAVP